jgi:hypothetical protein
MKKTLALPMASPLPALLLAGAVLAAPGGTGPAAAAVAGEAPAAEPWSLTPFLCVWQAVADDEDDGAEPDSIVEIARDYVSVVRGGKLDHREKVLAAEPGGLRPSAFDLAPRPLGEARPLPAERVAAIEAELARCGELDQRVREVFETAGRQPSAADAKLMSQVDSDNTSWLTALVAEVGWIDSRRFRERNGGKPVEVRKDF